MSGTDIIGTDIIDHDQLLASVGATTVVTRRPTEFIVDTSINIILPLTSKAL
jgi:hypothetical protein